MLQALLLVLALETGATAQTPVVEEKIELTRADALWLMSQLATIHGQWGIEGGEVEDVAIALADDQGRTRMELLVSQQSVAGWQALPPGEQTRKLMEARTQLVERMKRVRPVGEGLFGLFSTPTTTFDAIASQWVSDLSEERVVLTIGFSLYGARHAYVTVEGDTVRFHPDCPPIPK